MNAIILQKERVEAIRKTKRTRYVVLKGFVQGRYVVRGYVECTGGKIRVETYHAILTEALTEEIAKRCIEPRRQNVLEDLKYLLNTPLLSASEIMTGKPLLDKKRIIYGAELMPL
jgi:hypothetical protein